MNFTHRAGLIPSLRFAISTVRASLTAALIAAGALNNVARAAEPNFDRDIQPFLAKHCVACHNEKKQEGDFRIDNLSKQVGLKDAPQWAEVMERISSGEMPPEDVANRPSADEGALIVEWLSARMAEGEAARMASRERVSYHRLSRDEYVNTIYDLLGVHYDAADPGGFTEDPEWHGFERIGSILSLSPGHIEKYFIAAEAILNEAYPDTFYTAKQPAPQPIELHRPGVNPETVREPYKSDYAARGLLDKMRYEIWPQDFFRYASPPRTMVPGVYECKVKLSGVRPVDGRAPRLKFYHVDLDRVLFEQDILTDEDKPTVITFTTHLPASTHQVWAFNDTPGGSNIPVSNRHGPKPFVSFKEGRSPWQMKLTDDDGRPLYPILILDWIEWRGPIVTDDEAARRAQYSATSYVDDDLANVRKSLGLLATRAFRRPLQPGELDTYVAVVEREIAAGAGFRQALKAGMLAVLCSKSFLFLSEGSSDVERHKLNDWEIASRLSYFLWSTMPDEELFRLAEQGKLRDKQVLREQTARMLADPKAARFCDSFTKQWLQLRRVGQFPPDKELYPEYDHHLEQSMIGEPTAYFAEVLNKRLSLREFLDSDWTMVNPRLAAYYDLPEVTIDEFQRVALKPGDHRGGLLTQAATLSLSSDGTRHRPVHRGAWLSEAIFGKTPPPPPANVDPIEPNPVDSPKATLRMKLEAHKHDKTCASCHRKIDPLGLAFDNYDAIGRWRTHEVTKEGLGANPRVDASGELPDGRKFADADQFKKLLLADIEVFNHAFIEKLATYGLRRTMTFEDRKNLEAVAAASRKADYEVRAIVESLITSDLFQNR